MTATAANRPRKPTKKTLAPIEAEAIARARAEAERLWAQGDRDGTRRAMVEAHKMTIRALLDDDAA